MNGKLGSAQVRFSAMVFTPAPQMLDLTFRCTECSSDLLGLMPLRMMDRILPTTWRKP